MRLSPISQLMLLAAPLILSCDRQPTQPSDISAGSSVSPAAGSLPSAGSSPTAQSEITLKFDPNNFVRDVTNRFFPLRPGTKYVFSGIEDGEQETNVTIVTYDRKDILGVSTIVVFDRVFVHGELKEKTFDWYAQDKDGNVWYLGEDTKEYENGQVVSTAGSWKAGRQGAKPGIIMLAHPHITDRYFQEFLAGEAEDQARVVGRGIHIRIPYGSFDDCLKTVEWTRLEPGVKESKVYCPGVGFVKAHSEEGPFTQLVLTNITHVSP